MKRCFCHEALCLVLILSCPIAEAQVAEIVEKNLGDRHELSLVVLGPPNWRKLDFNDSVDASLGFIETKTGRLIIDLRDYGMAGFSDNKHIRFDVGISPDRTKVAVVLGYKRSGECRAFEIKGTEVHHLPLKVPDYRDVIMEKWPEIGSNDISKYTSVSATWIGNDGLAFSESGGVKLTGDDDKQLHHIKVVYTFRIKDGKALFPILATQLYVLEPTSDGKGLDMREMKKPGKKEPAAK